MRRAAARWRRSPRRLQGGGSISTGVGSPLGGWGARCEAPHPSQPMVGPPWHSPAQCRGVRRCLSTWRVLAPYCGGRGHGKGAGGVLPCAPSPVPSLVPIPIPFLVPIVSPIAVPAPFLSHFSPQSLSLCASRSHSLSLSLSLSPSPSQSQSPSPSQLSSSSSSHSQSHVYSHPIPFHPTSLSSPIPVPIVSPSPSPSPWGRYLQQDLDALGLAADGGQVQRGAACKSGWHRGPRGHRGGRTTPPQLQTGGPHTPGTPGTPHPNPARRALPVTPRGPRGWTPTVSPPQTGVQCGGGP